MADDPDDDPLEHLDRHDRNFRRQLDRYGRRVNVGGRELKAVWTPVEAAFDLSVGGLDVDTTASTHYISVHARYFDGGRDNPQGEDVTDELGDHWTINSTTHEPGDPELRIYLSPAE